MTLSEISAVFRELGQDKKVTALFITVDPASDTPEALKAYLQNFDTRIIGLTGDPDKLEAIAKTPKDLATFTMGSSISWTSGADS